MNIDNKIFNFLKTHLYLIKELSKREIGSKYKGSFLGIFWAFLTPVAMLFMFSFVFGEIFQAKWPGDINSSQVYFSINLFIGLSIFWFFADVIGKAPIIFTSVPNYVKKVVFPLSILPLVSLISALFHFGIYMVIIICALVIGGIGLSINILYLFLIIGVTLPMLMGIGLFFGSLGVYAKDISTIIRVVLQMLMFLSPVFYPLSSVPTKLQWIFELNPLTMIIENVRIVLLQKGTPQLESIVLYFLVSMAVFFIGYKVFKITKKGFADVL